MTSPARVADAADRSRRVAFVGLGHMGLHMCRNVTTAGHAVTAYDLDRRAVRAAVRTGARGAKSLPECLEGAEVLITACPARRRSARCCADRTARSPEWILARS